MESAQADCEKYRTVVALDYGDTSVAVAYAVVNSTNIKLDQIYLVSYNGSQKFPALLTNPERSEAAPHDDHITLPSIQDLDGSSSIREGLELIIRTLDSMNNLTFELVMSGDGRVPRASMSAEQLATEYLEKVFQHFLKDFNATSHHLTELLPLDLVLTIPVYWSYKAQNSLYRAVTAAGFNRDYLPLLNNVTFISTMEAASLYTTRYLHNTGVESPFRVGESYIICDAGEKTVDVASYRIKHLMPSLELELITIPTGAKCGSLYINTEFKKWLLDKIGEPIYKKLSPKFKRTNRFANEQGSIQDLMEQFLHAQLSFHSETSIVHLDLPPPLEGLNLPGLIFNGQISIPRETMRSFFDPQVDSIIELIQGHLHQIDWRGLRAKSLILVGDFAESRYLQDEIQLSMSLRGMKLLRPDTCRTAVTRGAVIYGAENTNISLSLARASTKSYGFSTNELPSESIDDVPLEYLNTPLRDKIFWVFKKGDLILGNNPRREERYIRINFTASSRRTGRIMIYSYGIDYLPPTYHSARQELTVETILAFDLTEHVLEKFDPIPNSNAYSCTLKLILSLDDEGITAALALDGIVISKSQ